MILASTLLLLVAAAEGEEPRTETRPPTFARDIAPIVYARCAPCHRPGGAGPFPLLTYDDVRSRTRQIGTVTRSRYMPPWLPAPDRGRFADERRLTDEEIARIAAWIAAGAAAGDPADLPPAPTQVEGWQLGPPDMVVELEPAYPVPAEGQDLFRNLVLPLPVPATRYVRAIELAPGNPRLVHHAVMRTDETRSSRLQDAQDQEPGFGSMNMGDAKAPDGYLLSWTPGHAPSPGRPGFAWTLRPNTDLVLQLHLQPTGKPETIQPRIGLYFADGPPTGLVASVVLRARDLDIAPGEAAHTIQDEYVLPVPLDVLSIYPHAHYLGKRFEVWADLPDGSRTWLLEIDDWDFNWQDEYRYAEPVRLPAGARVHLTLVYDNSATNPRNPSAPPVRVKSGSRSVDEMGTLTLQVVPASAADLALLQEGLTRQDLEKDPTDWLAHYNLAVSAELAGRTDEAIAHYRATIERNPTRTSALNNLALVLESRGSTDEALDLLRRALALNPGYADAHYNLARILQLHGQDREAAAHYEAAMRLDPNRADAPFNLGLLHERHGDLDGAIQRLSDARRLAPGDATIVNALGHARIAQGRAAEALALFREALALDPNLAQAHNNLANVLAESGRIDDAVIHYRRALEIDPQLEDARYNLSQTLVLQGEIEAAIVAARQRVTATDGRDVGAWMELADTLASAARIDEALAAAGRALDLATSAGATDLAQRIRQRMQAYRELVR